MQLIRNVTVARGNIVLADHGITTSDTLTLAAPVSDPTNFRLPLSQGPLTMQIQPSQVKYDPATLQLLTARTNLTGSARDAKPAVALSITFPTDLQLWTPQDDLLESSSFDQNFVVEVDNADRGVLRFGDDEYGRSVFGATAFDAVYRIGNGIAGNVGAEALAHVALSPVTNVITAVRNPLAAGGGVDPETIAQVQQWAPQAFRVEQFRAVTEADYAVVAQRLPQVQSAVASFRWTGSWYTVFIGVQPSSTTDLVRKPNGVTLLTDSLRQTVFQFLTSYRQTGYDLEIRPPQFLPLEIDLSVCTAPGYFRGDVEQAVLDALSSRILPDGSRGFFYPGDWVFGQSLYLSQLYAAVEAVQGVDSVEVTVFRQFGQPDNGELAKGVIAAGPWQIVQLDNDPNFQEHGVLKITMLGGKL
jgi:predicted phage baseplate assembly protein